MKRGESEQGLKGKKRCCKKTRLHVSAILDLISGVLLYYGRERHTHYITTQHNTTQHKTAQHNTTQHSTAQHIIAHYSTSQHNTAGHNPQVLLLIVVALCMGQAILFWISLLP
jgi:hypothetical protein